MYDAVCGYFADLVKRYLLNNVAFLVNNARGNQDFLSSGNTENIVMVVFFDGLSYFLVNGEILTYGCGVYFNRQMKLIRTFHISFIFIKIIGEH